MNTERVPFGLRMPEVLKQKVREQAEQNGRIQNCEICFRLEQAYRAETPAQNE